jgi:hypothetical protein
MLQLTQVSGTFFVDNANLTLSDDNTNVFNLASGVAYIDVADTRTFTVNQGGYDNTTVLVGARNNQVFADGSTVVYNNGGSVIETDANFPYGNLIVSGATAPTPETAGSGTIHISSDLTVNATTFNLTSGANSSTLYMQDITANANYVTGAEEVVGLIARDLTGYDGSSTITYNNDATTVDFGDNGDVNDLTEFALDVRPANSAEINNFDATRDVNRSIKVYHKSNETATFNLAYGFAPEEDPSSVANLQNLRMKENSATDSEKITGGAGYERDFASTPFRSVYQTGLTFGGDNGQITGDLASVNRNNVIFLRGGPAIFISIRDGRWSNPATWDELEQPGPEDIAVVRDNVHVGYVRANDNFTGTETDYLTTNFGVSAAQEFVGKAVVDGAYNRDPSDPDSEEATLLFGGNGTYQFNPRDLTTVGYLPDNSLDIIGNGGGLVLEELNGAITSPVPISTPDATANNFNAGFVVYNGATVIINGNALNNSSQILNDGKVQINN